MKKLVVFIGILTVLFAWTYCWAPEGDPVLKNSDGGVTTDAKDDGAWHFNPATSGESQWWIGVNHDSGGDDDDPIEWRQSATPGTDVRFSISTDGVLSTGGADGYHFMDFSNSSTPTYSSPAPAEGQWAFKKDTNLWAGHNGTNWTTWWLIPNWAFEGNTETGIAITAQTDGTVDAVVDFASIAETSAGTETAKSVTPDGLAGSVLGQQDISWCVFNRTTDVATGDSGFAFGVPARLNGFELIDVTATITTQGGTSGATSVQLIRRRAGTPANMLTTEATVSYNEYYANDETVNTSNDDLATGDEIYPNVAAIPSGGTPKGLTVTATFKLP